MRFHKTIDKTDKAGRHVAMNYDKLPTSKSRDKGDIIVFAFLAFNANPVCAQHVEFETAICFFNFVVFTDNIDENVMNCNKHRKKNHLDSNKNFG